MADAPLVAVADAIVYELRTASAASTFNRIFESEVIWGKRSIALKDDDMERIHVDVAAGPVGDIELIGSGKRRWTTPYDIGVRKRFQSFEEDHSSGQIVDQEIKDLVNLLYDICHYFSPPNPHTLSQYPAALWIGETIKSFDGKTHHTIKPVIIWDHILELTQFTGYFPIMFAVSE